MHHFFTPYQPNFSSPKPFGKLEKSQPLTTLKVFRKSPNKTLEREDLKKKKNQELAWTHGPSILHHLGIEESTNKDAYELEEPRIFENKNRFLECKKLVIWSRLVILDNIYVIEGSGVHLSLKRDKCGCDILLDATKRRGKELVELLWLNLVIDVLCSLFCSR